MSRKLIVTSIVSLDGYFEGPGNNVLALPMDGAFDAYCAERLSTATTFLLGRRTYDLFRGFWPSMAEAPGASDDQKAISRRDDEIEKVVISDSLTPLETAPWTDTRRASSGADAHSEIGSLEQAEGGDILVFGSRTLWNDLLAADLVDELHLMVGAVVLGGGTPAFQNEKTPTLHPFDTRTWEGSSNLLVRYVTGERPSPPPASTP